MNAVMKSFRFCGNSLSYITSFNLHLAGGPKFPDLLAYLASCGMRAAKKLLEVLFISIMNFLVWQLKSFVLLCTGTESVSP